MLSTSKDPETIKKTNEEDLSIAKKSSVDDSRKNSSSSSNASNFIKYIYVKLKFLLNYVLSKESCQCLEIVFALIHFSPKCFAG